MSYALLKRRKKKKKKKKKKNDDRQRFGNQRLFGGDDKTGAKEARKKFSRTITSSFGVETPKTKQSDTRAKRDLREIERGG